MLPESAPMAVAAQNCMKIIIGFLRADPMTVVQTLIYVAAVLNVAFITFVIIKYFRGGKK